MKGFVQVIIIGILGKDPTTRVVAGNTEIMTLSIASEYDRQDANKQWVKATRWNNVSVFGKPIQYLKQWAHKGTAVFVQGVIETKALTGQDGSNTFAVNLTARSVDILRQPLPAPPPSGLTGVAQAPQIQPPIQTGNNQTTWAPPDPGFDDIPY
jgi:single-strand DNA-binding protein